MSTRRPVQLLVSVAYEKVGTGGRWVAGRGVGSNDGSLLTSEDFFLQSTDKSWWASAGSAAEERDPAAGTSCALENGPGELVAFGFPQKGRRRPELLRVAAGLQLRAAFVD